MSDLAPILAAVMGPMLVFVVASMRYQHLDSTKTRDLIEKNRDLIEVSGKDNRRLIEKNRDLIEQSNKETRDLFRASHAELSGSLADARERLARIEGPLEDLTAAPAGSIRRRRRRQGSLTDVSAS